MLRLCLAWEDCMPETNTINLLRGHGESFLDKFLRWALTIGRFLVIVTETTALAVFAYRFSLDRQLVDLHDKIKQEQAIVFSLRQSEETYRNLQSRLSLVKQTTEQNQRVPTLFQNMISLAGPVTLTSIAITDKDVKLEVSAHTTADLTKFVNKVKTYKGVTSVSIDRVENKTASALINASITLSFTQKGEISE